MHRKLTAVAVVAVLGLGAAGCGTSGPLTRDQLVQKASTICKRRRADLVAAFRTHPGRGDAAIRAVLPKVSASYDALRALKPPEELKAAYGQLMAAEKRQLEDGRALLAGHPRPGDGTGPPLHRREALEEQLGLTVCG